MHRFEPFVCQFRVETCLVPPLPSCFYWRDVNGSVLHIVGDHSHKHTLQLWAAERAAYIDILSHIDLNLKVLPVFTFIRHTAALATFESTQIPPSFLALCCFSTSFWVELYTMFNGESRWRYPPVIWCWAGSVHRDVRAFFFLFRPPKNSQWEPLEWMKTAMSQGRKKKNNKTMSSKTPQHRRFDPHLVPVTCQSVLQQGVKPSIARGAQATTLCAAFQGVWLKEHWSLVKRGV